MALSLRTTLRNSRLDAIITDIGNTGFVYIYEGTRPATGGTSTSTLAKLTLSSPAASASASGVVTLSAITADVSADKTGTATWFRITKNNDTFVLDGDVGTVSSDLNLNTVSITLGDPIGISSFILTEGNA